MTGGCGFVGSNLVKLLVSNGYEVRVVDNLSKGRLEYLDGLDNVTFFNADILAPEGCQAAFEGVAKVVHLAAMGSVVESVSNPVDNFKVNVEGTFNVLNLVVKHSIQKLVFSSTGGALIGNATPPVSESSLPKPISPYGASKLCCEAYCHAFSESYGVDTICLRFANVYGPNSYHKTGVINKYFQALKDRQPLIIFGDGASSRDYIHVSDLIQGIFLALENDTLGSDVLHIASGKETTLSELAETVKLVAGEPNLPIHHKDMRAGEVERNFASYNYAKKMLGFEPKVSLRDGLQQLWDAYDWDS